MSRHISRFGNDEERAKLVAALMLTAKGVPFIYFGDEIGMRDWITEDIGKMKDVQGIMGYQLALKAGKSPEEALAIANEKSRDKSRTPMQWNSGVNAGFSEHRPWITIPDDACKVNVQDQQQDPNSMLSFYKKLLKLRKQYTCLTQGMYEHLNHDNGLLTFIRNDQTERILVMFNFADSSKIVEIDDRFSHLLLSNMRKAINGKVTEILANEVMILKEVARK
jgi:trehalose-6-phosphate hydrolase